MAELPVRIRTRITHPQLVVVPAIHPLKVHAAEGNIIRRPDYFCVLPSDNWIKCKKELEEEGKSSSFQNVQFFCQTWRRRRVLEIERFFFLFAQTEAPLHGARCVSTNDENHRRSMCAHCYAIWNSMSTHLVFQVRHCCHDDNIASLSPNWQSRLVEKDIFFNWISRLAALLRSDTCLVSENKNLCVHKEGKSIVLVGSRLFDIHRIFCIFHNTLFFWQQNCLDACLLCG